MNPDTRMAVSLVLSLAVSAQNLRLAALGQADIVQVGIRYVIGFVAIFLAVGAVGRVFNAYIAAVEERRAERHAEMSTEPGPEGRAPEGAPAQA